MTLQKPKPAKNVSLIRFEVKRAPKLRRNGDGRAFAIYPNSGGIRKYFGEFGTRDAETDYQIWLQGVQHGTIKPPMKRDQASPATISELADVYRKNNHRRASKTEQLAVTRSLEILSERIGKQPASAITPLFLTTLMNELATATYRRGERVEHYSRVYLNITLARWKKWFRWLSRMGLIESDLYSRILLVDPLKYGDAREPADIQPVPLEHVIAIKRHVSPLVYGMIQVQYLCGMRPGDVCRLRFCEIDTSGEVWIYKPTRHKTARFGKKLLKAIPKPAQRIILQYRPSNDDEYVFQPVG